MKINTTESEGKIKKDNEYAGKEGGYVCSSSKPALFFIYNKKIFLRYALCYVAHKTPTRKYTNRV